MSFFQARHPDKGYEASGVMKEFVNSKLRPEDVPDEVAPTVGAIIEITGKSITTIVNTLSLLLIPPSIQSAISDCSLPLSQGYLFAANLDCPYFETIFTEVIKAPVTNAVLEKRLTEHKKVKPDPDQKPTSLKTQLASAQSMKDILGKNPGKFADTDLQKLFDELQAVCALIMAMRQSS